MGLFGWRHIEDKSAVEKKIAMILPNPKEERKGSLFFDVCTHRTFAV
jgi:hypothetical protein